MFEVDVKNVMKKGREGDQLVFGALTRSLEAYGPFLLAPAMGLEGKVSGFTTFTILRAALLHSNHFGGRGDEDG